MVAKYKNLLCIPENVNYDTDEDYRLAERKFLNHLLEERHTRTERDL